MLTGHFVQTKDCQENQSFQKKKIFRNLRQGIVVDMSSAASPCQIKTILNPNYPTKIINQTTN